MVFPGVAFKNVWLIGKHIFGIGYNQYGQQWLIPGMVQQPSLTISLAMTMTIGEFRWFSEGGYDN